MKKRLIFVAALIGLLLFSTLSYPSFRKVNLSKISTSVSKKETPLTFSVIATPLVKSLQAVYNLGSNFRSYCGSALLSERIRVPLPKVSHAFISSDPQTRNYKHNCRSSKNKNKT